MNRYDEQVYNRHYDSAGNYHWTGVMTGEHTERRDDMKKMNCEECKYFDFCRAKNYTIEITTSDDEKRVFVFTPDTYTPSFCPYDDGFDKFGELRGMKNER